MIGAALFGMLVGLLAAALLSSHAPQPLSAILFWCLIALFNAWGGTLTWIRTRLALATAAMFAAALLAALLASLASRGYDLLSLPVPWLVVVLSGLALSLLLPPFEARLHPSQWKAWREAAQHASLWDYLRGKHIPHLR